MKAYRRTIATLEACVLRHGTWKSFDIALDHAQDARRAFQAARASLDRHLAKHGCDGETWRPDKLAS